MSDSERRLILLRHAESDRPEGVRDHERPLAEAGRRAAPATGRWLRERIPEIDLVLCSTATRAHQTWELIAAELRAAPRMRAEARIYNASAEELLTVVRRLHDHVRTVAILGHNPGLEDLVALLTGTSKQLDAGGIAVLDGSGSWPDAQPGWAHLKTVVTPAAR